MSDDLLSKLSPEYVAVVAPKELLEEICSWVSRTTALVATKHPYGFWVILLRRTDAEEWRFHVWDGSRQATSKLPAPIHTHDKIVDSRVLTGKLENVVYDVAPSDTAGLPIYEVRYAADKYSAKNKNLLIKTSERSVPTVRFHEITTAGKGYTVPAHVFHEAKVADGVMTCTIVRMHSRVPAPIRILGADGYPATIELMRASAPAVEIIPAEFRLGAV